MVIKRGAMSHLLIDLLQPLKAPKHIAKKLSDIMRNQRSSSHTIGLENCFSHRASYCAHLQGAPDEVLAPVLVRGLFQAAHNLHPDYRYWVDASGILLLINILDVEFRAAERNIASQTVPLIRPALPIITDYLFLKPLNEFVADWGGYLNTANPLVCSSGQNGFHLAGFTGFGAAFLTPNVSTIGYWHTGIPGKIERHVIEADLSNDSYIYWKQSVHNQSVGTVQFKRVSGDRNPFQLLPFDIPSHTKHLNFNRELLIGSNSNKLDNSISFSPLIRYFKHLSICFEMKGLSADRFDCLQKSLLDLLSILQHYALGDSLRKQSMSPAIDTPIQTAITECLKLIFSESLNISMIANSAIAIIKNIDLSPNNDQLYQNKILEKQLEVNC